ncbi:hypothetical protein [Jiangella gansuensis]|uniref:hypothetical protein n=1 Tax=Jiangella gansuensis TaxID=281473 RepID=UPI00047DDFBC|nr:hypothetical protein [Jiangella gansuensis]
MALASVAIGIIVAAVVDDAGTQDTSVVAPPVGTEFPTPETTGPREQPTRQSDSVTTTEAGQIIENVEITGRLAIRHDNVTVRDVVINGTTTYMLHVEDLDGTCPQGVLIEYIEIDGSQAAANDVPIYMPCGATVDHAYVHDVGRSARLVNDGIIQNSWIYSDRADSSDAHRGAAGTNGGSNNALINNVLRCSGDGCSAAVPMYGDFAPVDGFLVERNLLATTGGYCAHGGSVDSKPFPIGSNVRFIDNHFSTEFFPTCGRFGPAANFERDVRGNEWSGNVWHESGELIP